MSYKSIQIWDSHGGGFDELSETFDLLPFETKPQDEVTAEVATIRNCLNAIDLLFETVVASLEFILLVAKDDNTKEAAEKLADVVAKLHEDFYWKAMETLYNEDINRRSVSDFIEMFTKDGKETLLIPALRKDCMDWMGENFSEEEFKKHIQILRQQYGLSEDFDLDFTSAEIKNFVK